MLTVVQSGSSETAFNAMSARNPALTPRSSTCSQKGGGAAAVGSCQRSLNGSGPASTGMGDGFTLVIYTSWRLFSSTI
jgi:hypothetical protein